VRRTENDVIKKLQVKFIMIIMGILTVVLLLIFIAINLFMYSLDESQSVRTMSEIARKDGIRIRPKIDDGTFPLPPPPDDSMNPSHIFSVKLDLNYDIMEVFSDFKTEYSDEEVSTLVSEVLKKDNETGVVGNFRYFSMGKDYGKIIVFMDRSLEIINRYNLFQTTLIIEICSLVIIFIISVVLSRWALKPVKYAFERQKQFISDAGHELKTPLTVINTNSDVLERQIGKNKWLTFIKSESSRMSKLVNDLIYLAKLDDERAKVEFCEFNLSEAAMSVLLPFESVIFESGRKLNTDVEDDLVMTGDESRIKQLFAILIDNAVKYTSNEGEINVSLKNINGRNEICVLNTCQGISDDEKGKIFERFYQIDTARTGESGGYGLGLSIAKSIVKIHRGKIHVDSKKGEWVKFTVSF